VLGFVAHRNSLAPKSLPGRSTIRASLTLPPAVLFRINVAFVSFIRLKCAKVETTLCIVAVGYEFPHSNAFAGGPEWRDGGFNG